mmetsp:Transcript_6361/g.10552  ORF Transcript_6361/g.10552 Transcript_6361/m.10552 type:complete len:160 (+) Transcript_6361:595-1074(+)
MRQHGLSTNASSRCRSYEARKKTKRRRRPLHPAGQAHIDAKKISRSAASIKKYSRATQLDATISANTIHVERIHSRERLHQKDSIKPQENVDGGITFIQRRITGGECTAHRSKQHASRNMTSYQRNSNLALLSCSSILRRQSLGGAATTDEEGAFKILL